LGQITGTSAWSSRTVCYIGRRMRHYLDFEKPIAELEGKIDELRHMSESDGINIADEVARLSEKADRQLRATYAKLTPWQKVQVARHPDRPKATDYIAGLITDFVPLAGDRAFADDTAVLGGVGRFRDRSVMVVGTEKGTDTESRLKHNFGMARPEGYRKVRRLIELAGRFCLPVLSFVDTSGAFPGIEAEARGQAEAIARSIEACLEAPVPIVATIVGEGGSGGAIALAAGDRVLMLEHAIYSVISPEGCASILWRESSEAAAAAEALRLTAEDLHRLKLIDAVIAEPLGGAHRDAPATVRAVGDAVQNALMPLLGTDPATLTARRQERFLDVGRDPAAM
jgi:acetyl-CoA carboxylase carboxyl transferase subunit alpha